ncbi:MOSC N-terminal beta barrel domain-containing protein [Spinellus fusiger]|nr:MOSC N-terminal beta barrel domain-containing protein [Spinellus fusiger]
MTTTQPPTLAAIDIFPIKSCHGISLQECKVSCIGLENDRRFMIVDAVTKRFLHQRNHAFFALLRPVLDEHRGTLTLTSETEVPLELPLHPDMDPKDGYTVQLWAHHLYAHDMGDEAAQWLDRFIAKHRGMHPIDEKTQENVRLVTLDMADGIYTRPAHPQLPGTHSPFTDMSPVSFGLLASADQMNKDLLKRGVSQGATVPLNRFRNNLSISSTLPWEEDAWLVVRVGEVVFYMMRPIARCPMPSIDQDTGIRDAWGSNGVTDHLLVTRQFKEKSGNGFFCHDAIPLTSGTIRIGNRVEVLERIPKDHVQYPMLNVENNKEVEVN